VSSSPRTVYWRLALALLVYLGLRVLVLVSAFDDVCLPPYELGLAGNIAHSLNSETPVAPLVRFYDNCGGHLLTGLLAAPLFQLFGETYLVLKLVPLALGLATLVLGWWLMRRNAGQLAADVFAFAFALAPPVLLKYSLLAKGNHFENLVVQFALLAFVLELPRLHGFWPRLLCGALAGFTVFVYFGALLLLAVLAPAHLLRVGPRRAALDAPGILAGFLVGSLPLVWMQLSTHGRPFEFLFAKLAPAGVSAQLGAAAQTPWARIVELVTQQLPQATCIDALGGLSPAFGNAAFIAAYLATWFVLAAALWRRRSQRAERDFALWSALALYLPIFVLVYGFSSFRFSVYARPVAEGTYRYLVPAYAFATLKFGAVVQLLAAGPPSALRRAGLSLVALGLVSASAFGVGVVDWRFVRDSPGQSYPGYYPRFYNNVILASARDLDQPKGHWRADAIAQYANRFTSPERQDVWYGLGHNVAFARQSYAGDAARTHTVGDLCAPFDSERRIDLARGLGSYLRRRYRRGRSAPFVQTLVNLEKDDDPLRNYVVEGLGLESAFPLASSVRAHFALGNRIHALLPADLRPLLRRGQGIYCGRLALRGLAFDLQNVRWLTQQINAAEQADFAFGLGWSCVDAGDGLQALERLIQQCPPNELRAFYHGWGAAQRHAGSDGQLPQQWSADAQSRAAFTSGYAWPNYPSCLPAGPN